MYFAHTEEQEEFRTSVRGFFDQHLPHAQLPELLERNDIGTGFWAPMAELLGLQGIAIAEQYGGSEFGMVELTLVLEEAGRALVPEPLLATLLGAAVLDLAGDEAARATYLPGVAAGERKLTVALTDDEQAPLRGQRGDDGAWRLRGTKIRVLAGQHVDTFLVIAATDAGPSLFAVEAGAAVVEPVSAFDLARPLATVGFRGADAVLIGDAGDGERIAKEIGTVGALLLAAEQTGGAGRCGEIATEYAKEREQFGRKIGSFQAVKHQCADMLFRFESARTALMYAAWAWDAGADDRLLAVAAAKAAASDAYWDNARGCVQVLGGIGFTTEHPAQLHFKRATTAAQLFGSAATHRELIATQLIDATAVPA